MVIIPGVPIFRIFTVLLIRDKVCIMDSLVSQTSKPVYHIFRIVLFDMVSGERRDVCFVRSDKMLKYW